ncbi:AsmA family protein [Sulfurisoma sediminicola]|uniref:AsmA protein n=1 Tax=Sulfurisoma sediminicola TaxID=1381557 RepID=A0A497XQ26_9PROT|nr:AsmA family protein [Sulfurisoma sediminicola]RLJ68249.1 AsmA protein [Sulfurisoma sediminicola]
MKVLRIIGIGIAAVLLVAVAGIAFVMAKFDAGFIKAEATKAVQEKKQRSLRIDGPLELAFWPSLGVKVGKLSLSEHKSATEFLALDSARVSVAVMPLLSKQIVVDTIEIEGAKATLIRRKDGTLNIADLLAPDKEPSPLVKFDIAGIKVTNSQLAFRDEQAGGSYAVAGLNLTTGHLANAAEGPLELAAKVTASKPRTAADLRIAGRYRYDLAKQDFGLAKLDATLKGEVAGVQGLDLALAAAQLAARPATSELLVDGLTLTAEGKQGADAFDVKLEAPKLALTPDKASGEKIALTANLAGAQKTIAAKLGLAGVEGSAKAVKIARLDLDLDAKVGETSAKGKLSSPVAVQMEATTVDLPRLAGELDIASPQMPMKQVKLPLAGQARANWGKQTADGALNTQFDESKIAAKFNLARFAPPDIGFDVDIDRLNVDKYFPPQKKADGKVGAGGTAAKGTAPEEKIDLSALKSLNLHGTVKVGALTVQNVKASNVRLNINAAGGKLDVAPHSMNLYDGTLSGALSVNANGNSVALKQNLAGVNINPLMKDALDKDLIEGRGSVNLDVTTRGDTVTAMKKALAGSASLALKDGAVKGIDLAKSFRELKAKFSNKQDVVQAAKATDKTDFTELTGSFRIANGVAHNEDLAAKSPFLRLGGAGDIDIGNGRIDYLAKATVVNTSGGQGAKDLEYLKGVTVPVRLSGPFDNISYKLELGSLVQEAAKAKIEEQKQQLEKKATDKLQDSLKGLFKK